MNEVLQKDNEEASYQLTANKLYNLFMKEYKKLSIKMIFSCRLMSDWKIKV
jgi:hypothetical protein